VTPHRAALAAFCADNRIKLVHVWQTAGHWSAMLEWPYEPGRRKEVPTERHATGVGEDAVSAVLAGLGRLGYRALEVRVYVLGYMMGMR
jgi:hypothetical protein